MAKKIKFPLLLKNDVQARSLKDIQDNFDLEKIIQYYLDGKLIAWLESHYYDTQAESMRMLNKSDRHLRKKLCQIFGVEYEEPENTPQLTEIEERNRKLSILKQFTFDPDILGNLDHVAFDQEDLVNLLDDCVRKIYLCNNSFTIPLRVHLKDYIGLGNVEVTFAEKEIVYPNTHVMFFNNVHFNPDIEHWLHTTADGLYKLTMLRPCNHEERESYLLRAAEMGNTDAMVEYANHPDESRHKWFYKAADLGNSLAMMFLFYRKRDEGNDKAARMWLTESIMYGSTKSIDILRDMYQEGRDGYPKDTAKAQMLAGMSAHIADNEYNVPKLIKYFAKNDNERYVFSKKFSKMGYPYSMRMEAQYILGIIGDGSHKDMSRSQYAIELLEKNARLNADGESMRQLGECYAKGIGVQENFNAAEKWYNRAIQYNSDYMIDFAEMYEDKGMRKDALGIYHKLIDKASRWTDEQLLAKAKERINALESGVG